MNSGVKITGYTQVTGSDIGLTQALATIGPITAYLYAGSSKFQLYTSGVYSDPACLGTQINHAIMLVGYGADANNNPYYILRNSWGAGWGMNGYMYIARGNNMCSIASYNYYPSVTYTTTTKAPLTTSSNNNRVIACEGQSLTLQCPVGQNLNIIKVNYGRTDSSTCGSWSNTNCLLDQTNYFITQCNNKNQCTVVATNSVFGDPCRNTGKYLGIYI